MKKRPLSKLAFEDKCDDFAEGPVPCESTYPDGHRRFARDLDPSGKARVCSEMELRKRSKRSLTLLEIMIVILLIGLIGSVIGYNMKGSLEEGRAFKTEQGASQIRDILLLEVAKGAPLSEVTADPEIYLKRSGLVKNAKKILSDGWGEPYTITPNEKGGITVHSDKLVAFQEKKGRTPTNDDDED